APKSGPLCGMSGVSIILKLGFPIPVMDQVLPGSQAAPLLHGDIARHLHHPRWCRGIGRHARDLDLTASQMDEKQYVLDSGVFYCLTWVDTESVARQDDNLSLWRPLDRPSPVVHGRVHSGVDAPHRLANAMVPSRGHD